MRLIEGEEVCARDTKRGGGCELCVTTSKRTCMSRDTERGSSHTFYAPEAGACVC